MDEQTFQRGMAYLAAAYDREVTRERAAVYWDQLGNLRGDLFMAAVRVAVGGEDRFPTVARLRDLYRDQLRQATPNNHQIGAVQPCREEARERLAEIREQLP